jgi:hypothetical protein
VSGAVTVVAADLSKPAHRDAFLKQFDTGARDPMEGGRWRSTDDARSR